MPHVTVARHAVDLQPASHIEALLFDWDGTLFDNHHFNFVALAHGLNVHGVSITEEWFHANSGYSAVGIVEEAARLAQIDVDAMEVLRVRDTYANERLSDVPVIAPTMALLRSAGERKVGVVTGSNRSNISGLLDLHGLAPLLDVVITRDDVSHGKPHPEGYLQAFRHLGVTDPTRALIYEDSDQGIEAALRTGANVIDVRGLSADS